MINQNQCSRCSRMGVHDGPEYAGVSSLHNSNGYYMEISIDEAGSFAVKNAEYSSWCTVAAYVSPETEKRKYKKILDDLKRSENFKISEEIKLHQIDEYNYFNFLENLSDLKGSLLCVATDSHFNHENIVKGHQNHLILSIF